MEFGRWLAVKLPERGESLLSVVVSPVAITTMVVVMVMGDLKMSASIR